MNSDQDFPFKIPSDSIPKTIVGFKKQSLPPLPTSFHPHLTSKRKRVHLFETFELQRLNFPYQNPVSTPVVGRSWKRDEDALLVSAVRASWPKFICFWKNVHYVFSVRLLPFQTHRNWESLVAHYNRTVSPGWTTREDAALIRAVKSQKHRLNSIWQCVHVEFLSLGGRDRSWQECSLRAKTLGKKAFI